MKVLATVFFLLSLAYIAPALIWLQDMRLLYIASFGGLVLWTGALALGVISHSYRNTRMILQAIALVPDAFGNTLAEYQKAGSSTPLHFAQNDSGKDKAPTVISPS
ncbi:MAG: hypothetical protein ACLQGT_03025 [Terracidiphilus sp.]